MGFFTFAVAGGGFVLIGALEVLNSLNSKSNPNPFQTLSSTINGLKESSTSRIRTNPSSLSSFLFISISVLSFFFILNSLVSFFDAFNSHDRVGTALQLQLIAISSLFLLYSILGILVSLRNSIHFPSSILEVIALFAFLEEFMLFYLQRKDTSGIENRYFDLLLVPITVCVFSTIMELKSPGSNYPKIGRGVGLILQGTWILQMGLSLYTNLMTHGCFLHEKNRGNYTMKCKGHPEYHRAGAIATLLFNCHLAFLVAMVVMVYSIKYRRNGGSDDVTRYRTLGAEMQKFESQGQFTLDSDDDVVEEIKEEDNGENHKRDFVEVGVNGDSH